MFVPLSLVGSLLPSPAHESMLLVGVIWLVGFGGIALRASVSSYRAIRREREAGYSTLYGREFRALWHLDPTTGAVLREPSDER